MRNADKNLFPPLDFCGGQISPSAKQFGGGNCLPSGGRKRVGHVFYRQATFLNGLFHGKQRSFFVFEGIVFAVKVKEISWGLETMKSSDKMWCEISVFSGKFFRASLRGRSTGRRRSGFTCQRAHRRIRCLSAASR